MTLRDAVAAVAALMVVVGLGIVIVSPADWPALLVPLLLAAGCLFERQRYRATQARPLGQGWAPTGERFIDDASGRPITVWFNRASGERQYVDDESSNDIANKSQK